MGGSSKNQKVEHIAPELIAELLDPEDVLDLFAGHGWGVACQWLGLSEKGVEIMPAAIATRAANGMTTIYQDVWDGLHAQVGRLLYRMLIASPPCQTFSMAGNGGGRRALADVLQAIDDGAYKDIDHLRVLTDKVGDERTALVLSPLAYVWRDRPEFVVLEQVPQVLPVWIAIAGVLRSIGYSVWTGILDAEQYGVPQTRDRAILLARRDGRIAAAPRPTHSRYYSTDKTRLDSGVLPWVSMREALGWAQTMNQRSNYSAGGKPGMTAAERGRVERLGDEPSSTITSKSHAFYVPGAQRNQSVRPIDEPAPTLAFGHDAAQARFFDEHPDREGWEQRKNMGRGMVERHGDRPARPIDDPAFTIRANAGGTEPGGFVVGPPDDVRAASSSQVETGQNSAQGAGASKKYARNTDRPSPTVTGQTRSWRASTLEDSPHLEIDLPATTVVRPQRLSSRDHHESGAQAGRSTRITVQEAAILQSYPPDFIWCGNKTAQYQQVGNAVPPLLARACLLAVTDPDAPERDQWDHVFSEVAG